MSYHATVIEVFLSSPDDVSPEREFVVQYAHEWNRVRSRDTGCFIAIMTWEAMVAPALSHRVQDIVTSQMGETYDVYLGMMWTKFGTPTGVADSGTEEEFNNALERVEKGEKIRIACMFKQGDIDPSKVDGLQLHKVQTFKSRVGSSGAFYREFTDENSLRSILNLLFEQIAKTKDLYGDYVTPKVDNETGIKVLDAQPSDCALKTVTEDDDAGLLEVGEEFTSLVAEFTKKLEQIVAEEDANTKTIAACSEMLNDITKFGKPDGAVVRQIMKKAADSMLSLAEKYEFHLDAIESDALKMAELIDTDLRIRLEFDDPYEMASENITASKEMVDGIIIANQQLSELIKNTDTLPRLSSDVNRAKRSLSKPRRRLAAIFSSLQNSVENSVAFFEGELSSRPKPD